MLFSCTALGTIQVHVYIYMLQWRTLSDEDSNNFEGLITKQESLIALRQMKHDKSPGSDTYTKVSFQVFLCTFRRSINRGFYKGEKSGDNK